MPRCDISVFSRPSCSSAVNLRVSIFKRLGLPTAALPAPACRARALLAAVLQGWQGHKARQGGAQGTAKGGCSNCHRWCFRVGRVVSLEPATPRRTHRARRVYRHSQASALTPHTRQGRLKEMHESIFNPRISFEPHTGHTTALHMGLPHSVTLTRIVQPTCRYNVVPDNA
jgi:hypothetical protein